MHWLNRMERMKTFLIVGAIMLAAVSLVVSHYLVRDLKTEEYRRMEVWAEAMQSLNQADENTDISLVLKVLNGNHTIPVIVLDSQGQVQDVRNVRQPDGTENQRSVVLQTMAQEMKENDCVIRIDLADGDYIEICFAESLMLRRLALWPFVQMGIVLIFVAMVLFAIVISKRSEQDKVWVGLCKETAHQLGTPISSLMAWNEVLRDTYPNDELLCEMGKDVERLQRIADRFSKIGSVPDPKPENLNELLEQVARYIARRTSNNVSIECQLPDEPIIVNLTAPLFEWVVENLCKNAIDAMEARGSIVIMACEESSRQVVIEVSDTGRGIPRNRFQSVFKPGYTTKPRGWGLGLSLAKRIVEEYHKGHIFVKTSEQGKGTTFRIELQKA